MTLIRKYIYDIDFNLSINVTFIEQHNTPPPPKKKKKKPSAISFHFYGMFHPMRIGYLKLFQKIQDDEATNVDSNFISCTY